MSIRGRPKVQMDAAPWIDHASAGATKRLGLFFMDILDYYSVPRNLACRPSGASPVGVRVLASAAN
jgi:hypothetical protein